MTEIKRKLPRNPSNIVEYGEDMETATANAIMKMTSEKNLKMLSSIRESDIQRINLLLTLGSDGFANITFLKRYAYNELALSDSVMYKTGGIRSEQLTKIVKAPDLMSDVNGNGIMQNLRNKFRR